MLADRAAPAEPAATIRRGRRARTPARPPVRASPALRRDRRPTAADRRRLTHVNAGRACAATLKTAHIEPVLHHRSTGVRHAPGAVRGVGRAGCAATTFRREQ
ncbi:conserved hypothetical protein [Burkholderia pseudomallei 1106b]|uniref:Uncharacterized protein n=1 Tax=Burkholderia pseudomallei (strain 1106a) TaxID=357348 RepID=A3P9W3_BURP0|nr:conserved hypothetical protein [Burkholderia pseudomallei 1106a]AFR20963.1 hypothetical protein BPC006_II3040 [Burkholderia pseudomallei BPC006]EES22566.1 conserved hypothetical protein [Burkholderia pseudomallei 1106b]